VKLKLAIFILSLLVFLLAYMPAEFAKSYLQAFTTTPINTLKGSIWQGHTSSKNYQKLSWQLQPSQLLAGKLSSHIQLTVDNNNQLIANATLGMTQGLEVTNIQGTLNSHYLQQFAPDTPFLIHTKLRIVNAQAKWAAITPHHLPILGEGAIIAQDVDLLGENLGDYQLQFSIANKTLNGAITSMDDSSVDVALKIQLTPEGEVNIQGTITPNTPQLQDIFNELNIDSKINITSKLPQF